MKISCFCVLILFIAGCSELRNDERVIRDKYLLNMPIGSSYGEVNRMIANTFNTENVSYNFLYSCLINNEWVKARTITVDAGWYLDVILPVNTYLSWCFDKSDTLIELMVQKETDGI